MILCDITLYEESNQEFKLPPRADQPFKFRQLLATARYCYSFNQELIIKVQVTVYIVTQILYVYIYIYIHIYIYRERERKKKIEKRKRKHIIHTERERENEQEKEWLVLLILDAPQMRKDEPRLFFPRVISSYAKRPRRPGSLGAHRCGVAAA